MPAFVDLFSADSQICRLWIYFLPTLRFAVSSTVSSTSDGFSHALRTLLTLPRPSLLHLSGARSKNLLRCILSHHVAPKRYMDGLYMPGLWCAREARGHIRYVCMTLSARHDCAATSFIPAPFLPTYLRARPRVLAFALPGECAKQENSHDKPLSR